MKKPANEILNLPYFDSWLIGFIQAEGSFFVSKQKNVKSPVCYFTLTQKVSGQWILEIIKQRLGFTQKVRMETNGVWVLKYSSVASCQKLMDFLASCPMKLQGTKKKQLYSWIEQMRQIPRYIKPRWAKPTHFPLKNILSFLLNKNFKFWFYVFKDPVAELVKGARL